MRFLIDESQLFNTTFGYISLIVGSITGIVVALINKGAKKNDRPCEEIEKELKDEIRKLKIARDEYQNRWNSMKASFKILYNKYEQEFEGDHDKISMLKDLKEIFDL